MKKLSTSLPGVFVIEPDVFSDKRGFFLETYNRERYSGIGISDEFVQDNLSRSKKGVIRGLHYQINKPQSKLVWVPEGEIYDVAVDLRKGSPSFGKWTGVELSAENKRQLYIPSGFAHGFLVISESALVSYKCSELYHPESERGIIWNDPDIAISWGAINTPVLSIKDGNFPKLSEISESDLFQE